MIFFFSIKSKMYLIPIMILIVVVLVLFYIETSVSPSPSTLDLIDATPLTLFEIYTDILKFRLDVTGAIATMQKDLNIIKGKITGTTPEDTPEVKPKPNPEVTHNDTPVPPVTLVTPVPPVTPEVVLS